MSDTFAIKITVTKYNSDGLVTAIGSENIPHEQWKNTASRGAWAAAVIGSLLRAVKDDFIGLMDRGETHNDR